MIGLKRTTDASAELWSTTEAKNHLRVDTTADDTLIDAQLKAARELVEKELNRALITQTWTMTLDCFPAYGHRIALPWGELQSVASIQYVDENGDTQTLATSRYNVLTNGLLGRIEEAYGENWPTARDQGEAVTIVYVAGYGDAKTDVPMPIRHAVLLTLGDLYENREAQSIDIDLKQNPAVMRLLAPYTIREVSREFVTVAQW